MSRTYGYTNRLSQYNLTQSYFSLVGFSMHHIMATDSDKEQKKLRQDQYTVRTNILIGVILLSCYIAVAVYFPFPKLHLPTLLDRVVFTLRCLVVSLLAVLAGVMVLATVRFATTAINPLDPRGKKITEQQERYLQNTVEQFLLHSFSLISLSTYLSEEKMHWIPLLVALFVIGRALFFVGYSIDPMKRGVGFVITWYPTMAVSGYCLYCMCIYGVQAPVN